MSLAVGVEKLHVSGTGELDQLDVVARPGGGPRVPARQPDRNHGVGRAVENELPGAGLGAALQGQAETEPDHHGAGEPLAQAGPRRRGQEPASSPSGEARDQTVTQKS